MSISSSSSISSMSSNDYSVEIHTEPTELLDIEPQTVVVEPPSVPISRPTNTLVFMNGISIILKKIPKYTEFSKPFIENFDIPLANMILDTSGNILQITKDCIKNAVLANVKSNGDLQVKHHQTYGLGRFYATGSISLIPQHKCFKHTLFSHGGWADLDMVKGHPSIALEVFKGILKLPSMQRYVDAFDTVVVEMIEYYKTDEGKTPLVSDNIKFLFNIMIYGGTPDSWMYNLSNPKKDDGYEVKQIIGFKQHHPFVLAFQKECISISNMVFKSNPALVKKIKKDNADVKKGKNSCISYFFQIIENHIVYLVYELIVSMGIIKPQRCGLELDGLCLPPNGSVLNQQSIIQSVNDMIVNKTGLNIKFKFKPYGSSVMTDLIELRKTMTIATPIDTMVEAIVEDERVDTSTEIFAERVIEFEKNHIKIIGQGLYIRTEKDGSYYPLTRFQLIQMYDHLDCGKTANGIPVSFIQKWINCNPNINQKNSMDVYPDASKCPPDAYNLWKPFAMELYAGIPYEKKPEGLNRLLHHFNAMCDFENDAYLYFLGWIATLIQKPDLKMPCPVFTGEPGDGKSTIVRILSRMLGANKVLEVDDPARDIWGDFNGLMTNAYLVVLNEIEFADSKYAMGKLKALITEGTTIINQKGCKQISVSSHHKFLTTTNKPNPFKIEKGCRRFPVNRCSDDYIGNKEHFDQIYDDIDDLDTVRTLYDYFKTYDISKFKPVDIPQTDLLTALKEASTSPIEDWLKDFTVENMKRTEPLTISSLETFNMFRKWLNNDGRKFEISYRSFAVKISSMRVRGFGKGTHTNKGQTRVFDFKLLKTYFKLDDINVDVKEEDVEEVEDVEYVEEVEDVVKVEIPNPPPMPHFNRRPQMKC